MLSRISSARRFTFYGSKQYSYFCSTTKSHTCNDPIVSDVTIIGGGVSGLATIHRLRKEGFSVNAIEAGSDIGGTWYWNRYPGLVCDIESIEYSYEFDKELEQEYNWKDRYSSQKDILSYLNYVADKHDLKKHIQFNRNVQKCSFSESDSQWIVETDSEHQYISKHLILATGCLSKPNKPYYTGLQNFKGDIYYTMQWPHNQELNFADKRVAVMGTGSSGVQIIPELAKMSKHLTVYQRTAQYIAPLLNRPLTDEERQYAKDNYDEIREAAKNAAFGTTLYINEKTFDEMTAEEYEKVLWTAWNERGGFHIVFSANDQLKNPDADKAISEWLKDRIRETVQDERIAERLCPVDNQQYICKRALMGTNYFETYNRDNVELVSISNTRENGTPIKEIRSNSIITSDNIERECDVLIFATGFDALTGAILDIDIKGINDELLRNKWINGPSTYLGYQTVGFPNMYMITGPQSPSVLTAMMRSIEHDIDWISNLIIYMRDNNKKSIQPTIDAEQNWVKEQKDIAETTLFTSPICNSWYYGSNIEGKPRTFLPSAMGLDKYIKRCKEVVQTNYDGFEFDKFTPSRILKSF